MRFGGVLLVVSDMKRTRAFYETVMDQKVVMDLGGHISFDNGLGLQQDYEGLVGVPLNKYDKPDNFQIYFEVDEPKELDAREDKIRTFGDIEFLHGIKTYPWKQRGMRFYDPDNCIVEVAESMEAVAKRLLAEGLSAEEVSAQIMCPVEFVRQFR